MPDIASLVASIDRRLDILNAEISQLEKARHAIENAGLNANRAAAEVSPPSQRTTGTTESSEPAPARSRGRRARTSRSGPSRRKSAPLSPEDVERVLSTAESGLSAGAIADEAGAEYQATLTLLRELELAGRIRREGTRRSTRWHLITDEERIAARAAELERLVRRAS